MSIVLKVMCAAIFGVVCGLLGAYAGADKTSKSWRKIGISLLMALFAVSILKNWWAFFCLLFAYPYSSGYGIPDGLPPLDQGSTIGNYWYYKLNMDPDRANKATRWTIGTLKLLGVICLPIITGNWLLAAILIPAMVCNTALWGAYIEGEGMFTLPILGTKCLWEEFYRYCGDGFVVMLLILFHG